MAQPDFEKEGIKMLGRWFGGGARRLMRVAERLDFLLYRKEFGERDDDIYIITYPKSGTTLTQVILYQLTTDGDMSFNHIYDVSPWIRNAAFRKEKPKDLPSPRLIKSHDQYHLFPKNTKGRFIFVYRNGQDVAYSLFNQNKNYNNPKLTFPEFAKKFLSRRRNGWFQFNHRWFANKHRFPILYLRYEDLIDHKEEQIQKIISFLHLNVTPDHIARALQYSSFEYMKAQEEKFGNQPPVPRVFDQFIRRGKVGEGEKHFSDEQQREFDRLYKDLVSESEKRVFNKK